VEFGQQSKASIERLVGLNVTSMICLTQALLPSLNVFARGTVAAQIINIGSSFSYIGYPGFAVYCATKYAVRGFTQALDRELAGTGLAVRLFSPRATKTDINSDAVRAMNRDLGVNEDDPAQVAQQFLKFCASQAKEYRVGFPEKLFALLNQLVPSVVGNAIERQLPRIRKAFKKN
jgi:short-subunit dehydrogenase